MPRDDKPKPTASGLLNFQETRRANLESFGKTTFQQRVDWLADMPELMQFAREAGPQKNDPAGHHP